MYKMIGTTVFLIISDDDLHNFSSILH